MNDDAVTDMNPMHPGEMLREEFLLPLSVSVGQLAKACGVSRARIAAIVSERSAISAEMALRLGKVLGTSPDFWVTLQARHDMLLAQAAIGPALAALQPLPKPALNA